MRMVNNTIQELYPLDYNGSRLIELLSLALNEISYSTNGQSKSRTDNNTDAVSLIDRYGKLEFKSKPLDDVIKQMMNDFIQGTPRWVSPRLAYNVGSAPNLAALVMYMTSLEENIYLINDGLAGNCIYAENALSKMLGTLADCDTLGCISTFGGTGTNLYAMKLGINKACQDAIVQGTRDNVSVVITRDAHYSHVTSADWLGVGIDNIEVINTQGLYSSIDDLEKKLRKIVESNKRVGVIIVNGGTTYDHAIDDFKGVRELVVRITSEYSLDYRPHIHADTVIGWCWLFFRFYDFEHNPLNIPKEYCEKIRTQCERISNLKYVDSWGVDFHKGVGSCPVSTSFFCVNNKDDFRYFSKKRYEGYELHQIAPEQSCYNASEFTLETSRSAGAPLAALASLSTLGITGYQQLLSNLLVASFRLRETLNHHPNIRVCNMESLGFCVMVRVYPESKDKIYAETAEKDVSGSDKEFIMNMNSFNNRFYRWDASVIQSQPEQYEYSYSTGYKDYGNGLKLEVLKYYIVSPYFSLQCVDSLANHLIKMVERYITEQTKTHKIL